MCGIAAILGKVRFKYVPESLQRRGSDGQGIYINDNVQLIQTRLQITGRDKINLPLMHNGTVMLFNGQIYNYKILKRELTEFKFKYDSDYEVVLYSYIKWGKDFVKKLDGQFCILIYQDKQIEIFRDELGIRTCYIGKLNGSYVIASDIKSISKIRKPIIKDEYLILSKKYGYGNITNYREAREYELLQII